MNKLVGSFFVFLLLVGCSGQSTNNGDSPKFSPEKSSEIIQTAEVTSNVGSSPTANTEQAIAYLDAGKLKANFGFGDITGKHILVTGHEQGLSKEMALLNKAIGDEGKVLTVKFEKWQEGNEKNNGREMAHNFANLPGYLYTVEEGSATTDNTYYLADSADFNQQALLSMSSINPISLAVDAGVRSSISTTKERDIQSIWKLADLSVDRILYLVQFVRQDKDMLFSLVLKDEDKFSYMDYPAVIGENEYSVWRVDDGGEITPSMFSFLFAAETSSGLLLGMNWWGSEGVSTFFLNQDGDSSFREMDIQYGRYTSPL